MLEAINVYNYGLLSTTYSTIDTHLYITDKFCQFKILIILPKQNIQTLIFKILLPQ